MLTGATAQFADAIRAAGLTPPDTIEPDGELHRFASNGKRSDDAGWYVLHDDGIAAGSFGDWRTGLSQSWRADIGRKLSPAEAFAHSQRIADARRKRDEDEARRNREARDCAAERWAKASVADPAHRYLAAKGVKAHGIRQEGDALLVPMRDGAELHSLQTIAADGEKRFLYGGRVSGCYFGIGKPGDTACVAEGFATGATIHEATGYPVAVAFNAGNLEAVARTLRARLPDARIIICADDDYRTPGNPGHTKASEAARAVSGFFALPEFGTDRPEGATDFNDLARHHGTDAVRRAISNAIAPEASDGQPDRATDSHDWPDPQPLSTGLPAVAPFDFALMPDLLQPWALDVCDLMQCPPDFVGAATMTALGSLIGRKVGIRPQARTDWTEVANMWAMIVGRPGVLKSPAVEASLSPIRRLSALAAAEYEQTKAGHELAAKVAKMQADLMAKAAADTLKKNPKADISEMLRFDSPDEPTLRRYYTTDSTAAALGELLRQNPNGLLVHRDELVSLLRSLDQEDNAAARGFYLTGWNGNSPYVIDRIGRGMNLHIDAVCISILGSTQPGRVAEYIHHAVRGGKGDDGLMQRFGLLVWPDVDGKWTNVDRAPDRDVGRAVHDVFQRLDHLDWRATEAERDIGPDGDPDGLPYLRFDGAGQEIFNQWRAELEARLRGGDLHPALEAHLAKYRKLVPGLALICHLTDGGHGPIPERAIVRALAWAQYLETHARRAYASVSAPESDVAKAIVRKLKTGDLPRSFSSRDVWRPGWAMLSDRVQVADALQLLVELDWLVTNRIETGGRTATVYHANPRGLQ